MQKEILIKVTVTEHELNEKPKFRLQTEVVGDDHLWCNQDYNDTAHITNVEIAHQIEIVADQIKTRGGNILS